MIRLHNRLLCHQPSCGLSTSPVTSVLFKGGETDMLAKWWFFLLEHVQWVEINFQPFRSRWDFGFEIYGEKVIFQFLDLKLRKLYRVESPKETSTTSISSRERSHIPIFSWHFWVNQFPFSLGYVIIFGRVTLTQKTNMTIENPPFDDVFPIETWGFSNVIWVFRGLTKLPKQPENSTKPRSQNGSFKVLQSTKRCIHQLHLFQGHMFLRANVFGVTKTTGRPVDPLQEIYPPGK